MSQRDSRVNRVTHVPPDSKTINQFAQDVCQQLAVEQDDPTLNDPQIVWGLAAFLGVVAEIGAKHLNKTEGESLDKPSEDR